VKGGKWYVPVNREVASRNDTHAARIVIVLNRAADLADNDEAILAQMLVKMAKEHELAGSGYDGDALDDLLKDLGAQDTSRDDLVPEPPKKAITKPGDLWTLGAHRLLCGDSTKAEDVARVMGKDRAMLMATDPPYMVDYGHWKAKTSIGAKKDWSATYKEVSAEQLEASLRHGLGVTPDDVAIYVWHSDSRAQVLRAIFDSLKILWHQTIIWAKPVPIPTRCVYLVQHEPCAFGWKQGTRARLPGGGQGTAGNGNWSTVWSVDHEGKARANLGIGHPTSKPVELCARPIQLHTKPGEVLYEPFSGSGTQIIAAEKTGRRCRAIEIEPRYVDVAVERWQTFAHGKATRQSR
jgi:DNA modification methylase